MEFTAMLQKDLMILAREHNIKGRSKMRKADLVKALHQDELERKEGRGVGKEEKKRGKSERKAQLKETRKDRKRAVKEEKERKKMRTKSEKKRTLRLGLWPDKEGTKRPTTDASLGRVAARGPAVRPKAQGPVRRSGKKNKGRRRLRSELLHDPRVGRPLRRGPAVGPTPHSVRPRRGLRSSLQPIVFTPEVIQTRSALKGFARQYVYEGLDSVGPREFLEMHEGPITDILDSNPRTKVRVILKCVMEKRDLKTGEVVEKEAVFHSKVEVNLAAHDMAAFLQRAFDKIMEDMAAYTSSGSGWRFKRVNSIEIHLADFAPLKGNSFIPLPKKLVGKRAIINMKNEDDECFKWCITRALNPTESHPERITRELRRQSEEFDWSQMTFPVEVSSIEKFEASNGDIAINVFWFDEEPKKGVTPLWISPNYSLDLPAHRIIDLLLIEEEGVKHYCLIKNLSRLLSSQVSKHKEPKVFCRRCLNHFPNEEKLAIHNEYCKGNKPERLILPSVKDDGSAPILKFKNFSRKIKVPDVIYADFEALTEKISGCQPDPSRSFTNQYQKHEPCGFSFHLVHSYDGASSHELVAYRMTEEDVSRAHASLGLGTGHFVAQKFVEMLEEDIRRLHQERGPPKKMIFTKSDKHKHLESRTCWICGRFLKGDKVRDHCHFTGKYRGAAHNRCNLQFQKPKFTPVIFHNLSGYDSHLFVKNLGKSDAEAAPPLGSSARADASLDLRSERSVEPQAQGSGEAQGNIRCIPNNEEKYISFSKFIKVGSYINKKWEE